MKRWIGRAARLYPARWRARYGRELAALVEDAGCGWRDIWDVLVAAMEMQMATWSSGRIAVAVGLAGALIAAGLTLSAPRQFVATGTVEGAAGWNGRLEGLEQEVLSRTFLATMIIQADLYKTERQRAPLEDIVERMRRENVRIAPAANGVLRVSFRDNDPATAQRIAHWIVNQMAHVEPSLRVVSAPEVPKAPAPAWHWPAIAYGLVAGLAAGGFGAWLWRRPLRWTLRMTALAVAGALAGAGYFCAWWFNWGPGPLDHYTSSAVLRVPDGGALEARIADPAILQTAVADAELYHGDAAAVDRMRRELRIVRLPVLGADVVAISFTYTDRYKAQRALRSIVDEVRADGLEVIDPSSVPEQGRFRAWHFIGLGMLLGIGAGLLRWNQGPILLRGLDQAA